MRVVSAPFLGAMGVTGFTTALWYSRVPIQRAEPVVVRKEATKERERERARSAGAWAFVAVVAGAALLGGCRAPLPEAVDVEAAPGAGEQVAFVRDMMIENAKLSKGPARTEKAVEAVRKWGGAEDGDAED